MFEIRWFWRLDLDFQRIYYCDGKGGSHLGLTVLYLGPLCVAYHHMPPEEQGE